MSSLKVLLIGLLLVVIILLRFYLYFSNRPQYRDGQVLELQTTLLSQPSITDRDQRFTVVDKGERIIVILPRYPDYHYGDTIKISGTLRVKTGNSGVIKKLSYPSIKTFKNNNLILGLVTDFRSHVISVFNQTLPQIPSSLLLGIVFGIRENMPSMFLTDLRSTGVMHVIAASGMNVTMIAGFFSSIFIVFARRQFALILTLVVLFFYALLSGFEASIIRASLMGGLAFGAQILGRQKIAGYSLFLTGYSMLFASPDFIFDIGFQLSFISTLSILYIKPLLDGGVLIRSFLRRLFIRDDITTTLSAQIGTLPILLFHFGTYSFWSVIVNGLVLWVVPILMILGGAGAILSFVFLPFAKFFLYLSLPFLMYFQLIVSLFSRLGGNLKLVNFPWQIVIGYYFLLLSILFVKRYQIQR